MRSYDSIEECMKDYAAFMIGRHPELKGVTDVDLVITQALKGYATNPSYQSDIRQIINRFDLTRYDVPLAVDNASDQDTASETESNSSMVTESALSEAESAVSDAETESETDTNSAAEFAVSESTESAESAESASESVTTAKAEASDNGDESKPANEETASADSKVSSASSDSSSGASSQSDPSEKEGAYRKDQTDYTAGQMDQIEQIVASYESTYDGALAVISTAMNRADVNFGGFGTNADEQLTAQGQYGYTASAAYPNDPVIPDAVRKAVEDCLKRGIRNTEANTVLSQSSDDAVQIGLHWFIVTNAPSEAEDAQASAASGPVDDQGGVESEGNANAVSSNNRQTDPSDAEKADEEETQTVLSE